MDLAVGPIESYIPGSTWFDLTQYSDLGTQERVSVNLTSSNLWLVDQSQLNFQDSTEPPIVLPAEGVTYESPVQISATSIDPVISAIGGSYVSDTSSSLTVPTLETGGTISFSGVNGEIDSDAAAISSDSGQASVTVIQSADPINLSVPTNPNSPLFSTAYPNSNPPATSTATSDTPTSSPTNLFPPTSTTDSTPDITPNPTPALTSITPDSTPGTSTPEAISVPFSPHMSIGLMIVILLMGKKIYRKVTSTQTLRQRDRNDTASTLELTAK